MEELIIDRTKWGRGESGGSMLVSKNENPQHAGKMCCLGFLGLQCGFSKDKMRGNGGPSNVLANYSEPSRKKFLQTTISNLTDKNSFYNNKICCKLMHENDDCDLSDKEREKRLKQLFKEVGVRVKLLTRTNECRQFSK